MQTIARRLKVTDFPFKIKDKNGRTLYYENLYGSWSRYEYDSNGNEIYCEASNGFWYKKEFDSDGNEIYCESSEGYWYKKEFDSDGKDIYHENSNGLIIDKRPKTEVQKALELLEKEGMLIDGKVIKN